MALPPLPSSPLVSVLMSNYNYAPYLGAAIDSVLAQTYQNIQLVICDDGSSDGSRAIVERYAATDRRITALFKSNGGQPSGWNMAWPECHGEIICVLDADDTFAAEKIAAVVAAMQKSNCGLLIHALTVTDAEGTPVQRIPFLTPFERGFLAEKMIARGGRWRCMPSSALCLRREVADFIFPVPEDLFMGHADSMVVGLAPLLAPVDALDDCLGTYRVHGRNTMGGDFRDLKSARQAAKCMLQMAEGVNCRLAEIGSAARLNPKDNPQLLQASFMVELLEGRPRLLLIGKLPRLLRALWRDDMYRATQKLLGSVTYTGAVLLPVRLRGRWLGMILRYSRLKNFIQTLLRILTPRKRRSRPFAATAWTADSQIPEEKPVALGQRAPPSAAPAPVGPSRGKSDAVYAGVSPGHCDNVG